MRQVSLRFDDIGEAGDPDEEGQEGTGPRIELHSRGRNASKYTGVSNAESDTRAPLCDSPGDFFFGHGFSPRRFNIPLAKSSDSAERKTISPDRAFKEGPAIETTPVKDPDFAKAEAFVAYLQAKKNIRPVVKVGLFSALRYALTFNLQPADTPQTKLLKASRAVLFASTLFAAQPSQHLISKLKLMSANVGKIPVPFPHVPLVAEVFVSCFAVTFHLCAAGTDKSPKEKEYVVCCISFDFGLAQILSNSY